MMDIKHKVFCFMGIGQICFSAWASVEEKFQEINKFDTLNLSFVEIQDSESGKKAQKEEHDALGAYNFLQKMKEVAAVGGPVVVNFMVALLLSWISKSKKAFVLYFAGLEIPSFFAISRPHLKKEEDIQSLYPKIINEIKNVAGPDQEILQKRLFSEKVDYFQGFSVDEKQVIQNIDLAAFVGYPKLFERELKKIFSTLSFENEEDLSNFQSSFLRRTIGLLMEGEFYQLWKILLRFVNGSQFFVPVVLESLYQAILQGRQEVIDALWKDLNTLPNSGKNFLIHKLLNTFVEVSEISDKEKLSIWNVPQEESWKFLYSFVQKCVESQIELSNEIYDYLLMAMSMGTESDDQDVFAKILEKSSLNLQSSKFYLCLEHLVSHTKVWCVAQIFKKLSQQNVDLNQHIPEKFCRLLANNTKSDRDFKEFDQSFLEFILRQIDILLTNMAQSTDQNFPWHDIGENLFNLVRDVDSGQDAKVKKLLNLIYERVFVCLKNDPCHFSFDQQCKDLISRLEGPGRAYAMLWVIMNADLSTQDVLYLVKNFPQDYFMQRVPNAKVCYVEVLVESVLSRGINRDLKNYIITLLKTTKDLPVSVYGLFGQYMGKNEKEKWKGCEDAFYKLFAQNYDQDVLEKEKLFLCNVFNNRKKDQQRFLRNALYSQNSQIQQVTMMLKP